MLYDAEALKVRGPSDTPVCTGTFAHMAEYVFTVQAKFDVPFRQVSYTWDPESYDASKCPAASVACAEPYSAYSKTLSSEHELFHASRPAFLPKVLEEGSATMFGEWILAEEPISREQFRSAVENDSFSVDLGAYERAAHFVSFLIWWQGLGKFIELQKRIEDNWYDKPFSVWQAELSETFGTSWEEIWATYDNYPDCSPLQVHWQPELCFGQIVADTSVMPALMIPAEVQVRVGCDEDSAVGPVLEEGVVETTSVLDIHGSIGLPLWVQLESDEESGAIVTLVPACSNCMAETSPITLTTEDSLEMAMFSGTYIMRVFTRLEYTGTVRLVFSY